MNLDRLVAYTALLARPDDPGLHRGQRERLAGAPDRMARIWLHSAQTWTQHRIAAAHGSGDGWKPAARARVVRPRIVSIGRFA